MATSLGYVLMNWTSTFNRKHRKKVKKQDGDVPKVSLEQCCQAEIEVPCLSCEEKESKLVILLRDMEAVQSSSQGFKRKLSAANRSLASTIEKESLLRHNHETLILEEAQARYDLDQLRKQLSEKLEQRDQAHAERVKLLEQTIQEKECDWVKRNERLRQDLREALRSSIEDTEREAESLGNLEQEIESLRMVVEMRSSENRELRIHNNELVAQVERLSYLEAELANARHRLDEMTLVLQNKMDSERELLELSETLQRELVKSRAEILHWKKNVENHQYLVEQQQGLDSSTGLMTKRPVLKVQHSHSDLINNHLGNRNQHQQLW